MDTNHVPPTDWSTAEPGCHCPKFDPAQWNDVELHFRDKPFVRVRTRNFFHVPLNIGEVFARTWNAIREFHALEDEFIVLSDDSALWHSEHFFNVKHMVPGLDNLRLSGDFLTRVFEGPYGKAPRWARNMRKLVKARGKQMTELYFYYVTCPKCAKRTGKNYTVGVARLGD